MIGSFQSEINTAFALADKFKSIYYHGLDYSYYNKLFDTIRNITPSEVSEIANRHIDPDSFLEVSVG
jgi:predicted Zn-dependent peptidase